MEAESVPERAEKAGEQLASALLALPGVIAVRGLGLLLAAELVPGIDAKAVAMRCLDEGLVVNAVTPSALRFAPPLLVRDDEIDEAVTILDRVLTEVAP
jgi:acetylornithine aminotransferase